MKFASQLQIVTAAAVPPFTVNQTERVINLNADLLDGQHGAYYATAASLSGYLPLTGGTLTGTLTGTVGIFTTLRATELTSPLATNGPITITPDGTGHVHINSTDIRIGPNNTNATLATRGTGDLILRTNEGSAVEGFIRIYDGANGNIEITPNGTGTVVVGKLSGSTASFSGQITSTVASGTAPLVVTSNFVVANLNSDFLDGQHGSFYQNAGNLNAGTLQAARLPAFTGGDVTSTAGTVALTLANSGVTAGTYTKVTVDAKGRVTTGALLASADLPTYTGTITSGQVTTALGFTPYNATNPSGYITSSATITGASGALTVNDTRSSVTGPSTGVRQVRADFLANSTDGLSDGGTYHGVLTFQQWADASGGGTRQLAFTDNDNMWLRGSGTALTAYGSWKLILNSVNYSTYALPLSGGTLTGQLFSNSKIETSSTVTGSILYGEGTGLTGTAPSLTAGAVPWTGVTGKPTTLAGYGITDALPLAGGTLSGLLTAGAGITMTGGRLYVSSAASGQTYGGTVHIRDGEATGANNSFAGIAFSSAPGADFVIGKYSNAGVGKLQIRNHQATVLATIEADGSASFAGGLTATNFTGPGTGLTGTAAGLSIGGSAVQLNGQAASFYQNAGNLNAGTLLAARMPAFTGGDVTSTVGTVGLNLTAVGTAGTYRSVTTDSKGRVTGGTNPTTLAGYGITDALPLSGGTLSGTLSITNTGPVIILRDSDSAAGASQIGYISLQDSAGTERGWIGFGSTVNTDLTMYNGRGDVVLSSSTGVARVGTNAIIHAATTSAPNLSVGGSSARWANGRTISLTGDVSGTSAAFDGTAALSFATTLANSGVTAGTYRSVTVNAKGLVTAGTNPTTLAGYGITDALDTSGAAQTKSGNLTVNSALTSGGAFYAATTVQYSNRQPIYTIYYGGGQDLAWKKVADITIGTGLYRGVTFKVDVVDNQGNFGFNSSCFTLTYFATCIRSGGIQDDYNNAVVTGPVADYVRVVKTATGVYELQIRQLADWQTYVFTVEATINSGGNTVTYASSTPPNGSTTGTIYTATPGWTSKLANIAVAGSGSFAGQITSTVATGTAPLVITSTTAVANLNSDFLDGQHGSYFEGRDTTAVGFSGGTLTLTRTTGNLTVSLDGRYLPLAGGTLTGGLSGTTGSFSGQITSTVATGTAPFVVASTTQVNNLNAQLLGGQLSTYYAAATSLTNYLPLSGGGMTGALTLHSTGSNGFYNGTGDAATYALYNFKLGGWNGMALENLAPGGTYPSQVVGVIDFRGGTIDMKGGFKVNGASVITENQSITISGDASGTGKTAINLTLTSVGTAGTYRSVTTDAKGRVTAGTNPTTLAGYGITDALPLTGGTLTGQLNANSGLSISGSLFQGDYTRRQIALSGPGTANFGNWKQFIRLWAATGSGTNLFTLKVSVRGQWNWSTVFGTVEAYYSLYLPADSTINSIRDFRITHVSGPATDNIRLGDAVIENGFVSIPVWGSNTNALEATVEQWTGSKILGTVTTAVSEALPAFIAPSFRGGLTSNGPLIITDSNSGVFLPSTNDARFNIQSGTAGAWLDIRSETLGYAAVNLYGSTVGIGRWSAGMTGGNSNYRITSGAQGAGTVFMEMNSSTNATNFPNSLQQGGNAVLTAASTSAPNLSVGGSAGSVAWTGVTGKPTTLAGYGITDALSSTINQQGGKAYTVHDFNTYPSLYDVTFVNPTGSTNLPTGMSAVMSYRFIMGAGDTATRGFDLVGAAEGSGNLYIRERSLGTWSRVLHSNNFPASAPNSGVTAGTYNNVTVTAKGLVTGGSNVSYLTGNQTITLGGDLSGSGTTSITATIANSAVTNAKLNTMGAATIKGNNGGVANSPSDLSVAQVATMLSGQAMNINGSAASVPWTGVTGKPTTLSGYGITDALPITGGTLTGVLGIQTSSDNQLLLQGTDTWAGIGFRDSANVTDYIWYWGATQTFAIGGGGSSGVSGKKLHIDGGVTIGSSYDAVSMPTNGLNVEGAIQQAGNQVLHAGNYNSYAMLTSGIPSGSDQYVNFRVIRNSAASPADGMYIGYGNTSGGRTRIYGEGSTSGHFWPDSSGNLFRSDGVAYIHSSNVGNYIVPQTNYTTAINATGYTWIRIPYANGSAFNSGQSPVEFYVTRSIYDNSSTPYGGPTAKFVIQSMEWHNGQQMGTIQYGERGDSASLGAANWITHAKVTNMSGGGYWVYMRLRTGTAAGVTYMFRRSLVGGQGLDLAAIEATTDPGGAATIYYGFNLISAGTEARFYRDGNMVLDAGTYNSYALPLTGGTLTGALTATNFSGPGTGLTGTAASLTAGAVAWTGVTGKPTTISGYGITDIVSSNSGSPVAADTTTKNGFYYVNSNISLFGQTDGALFVQAYDNTWASQIYQDYRTGQLAIRGRNSGTWQAWRTVLDSTNFLTSAPNSGVTAGTYNNVTVNAKGIVTAGSNVSYLTGNQTISLTGDLTGSGTTSITATIAGDSVTNAKLKTMAATTIKGNNTAVANAPADLTPAQVATMLSNQTMNINGSSASCTGNAATATSSPLLSALSNYVWSASTLPTGYNQGIQASFVQGSNGFQSYGSVVTVNTYSGGGGALQLYVPYSPTYGGTGMQVRFGNYDVSSGNSWTSWKTLLASDNYSSYALPLTGGTLTGALTATSFSGAGTGLTGTAASLSIGGSAGSVAASGITGQTGMWTSAARPGPYRLYRRDVNDAYSVQNYWTGTYWRLDGYYSNDTVHAGCSVAYADTAGSVSTIADGAVSTTAKLANSVVTYAKIQNVGASSVLGNTSASVSQAPQEITFSNLGPYINGVARAWVTFNENPSTGAITINASLGISSVTRINYGQYRVNFSTAFADANYAVSGTIGYESNGGYLYGGFLNIPRVATPKTTTYCEVTASYGDGNTYNARFVHVVFDR